MEVDDLHGGSSITRNEEEMKIYMKVTRTIAMQVNRSDTIRNVKAKFSHMEGYPSSTQDLFFGGDHLKNGNKLVDYNIQNGSTIQMFLGSATNMEIHIKASWLGDMITFNVNRWETVHNVKAKVHDMFGVLLGHISLIYNGKELEDSQTLATYNIQTGSTLFAVFRGDNTIRIFVHTLMNGTVEVEVKTWYSVANVKVLLESLVNIPSRQQRLFLSERIMEDDKTLLHYDVQSASEIRMVPVITFFVETSSGKRIEMVMEISDKISSVKRKIQEAEFVPPYKQVLSFCGVQLEDFRNLTYYKIEGESTLKLDVQYSNEMQIFVRTLEGRTRALNVLRSDSIASVKEKIEVKEGIPKGLQNITFCGKVLESNRSLEEYGIEKESTLHLGLNRSHFILEVPVWVRTSRGRTLLFNMPLSGTIGSLKGMIENMERIPKRQQRLMFGDKLLEDKCSLNYYGIVQGSTLSLSA